jgi:peptide/nickel transport system substrate-binding protein
LYRHVRIQTRRASATLGFLVIASLGLAGCTASPEGATKPSGASAPTTGASTPSELRVVNPTAAPMVASTSAVAARVSNTPTVVKIESTVAPTSSSAGPAAKSGGTLRWAVPFEPPTLNSALRQPAGYPWYTSFTLFDGLTRLEPDQQYKPVPALATSWEISADGKTYTFKLRDGVKWHDGQSFSADDVKFTLEAILDPKNRAATYTDFTIVERVEVIDRLTVRIILKQPFAPMLTNLAVAMIPKHLLEGKDLTTDEFNQKPVGTGPFRFVEWRKGESLTLEANPDSWRGRPKLDRVVFRFVEDASARLVQLKTGEVDGANLDAKQAGEFKDSDKIVALTATGSSPHCFALNLTNPLFADPRVRQALNYGVDKEALLKTVGGGAGVVAYGPLQNTPYDRADLPQFKYDPQKVDELLTGAGWNKNASGSFEKDGKTLSFTLIAPVYLDEATLMASSLRQVGIDVQVDQKDYRYVYSNLDKFDAVMYSFGSPADPDSVYFLFHSSGHADKAGFNFFYTNPKVDDLLDRARSAPDPALRKSLYAEFQAEVNADPPYVWGWYPSNYVGVRKDLVGLSSAGLSGESGWFAFWNMEAWGFK